MPINVVYLHSHDTGRYIQPYGYAVPTPNLQRFAEQGVLFRQAFCAGPTCSPSRAALMTGRWPHEVGMFGLAHKGWSLADESATLVKSFNQAGYHTALGGFQHITTWGDDDWQRLGYTQGLETKTKSGEQRAAGACAFLEQDHDKPFFLDLGFGETHRTGWVEERGARLQWHNGQASPTGDPRYVRPPATLPDTPTTREDFADYVHAAGRLDALHGQVLDTLEATGLAENTLVIITTDHGIAFPRMKSNLTDHGLGVLLMMRGPASLGLTGGKVIDAMVSHTDVVPSVCEWLGLTPPAEAAQLAGQAVTPLLNGEADPADAHGLHEAVYGGVTYHGKQEAERAVRTERYKYIRRYQDAAIDHHSCDGSTSKELMLEQGWGETPMPAEQLYDLTFDPMEANNLADRPGHEDVKAALRGRLETWMARTGDPALAGRLPMPAED